MVTFLPRANSPSQIGGFAVGNPQGIVQLENTDLATGEPLTEHHRPDEQHWARVAGTLHLDDDALHKVAVAHQLYKVK